MTPWIPPPGYPSPAAPPPRSRGQLGTAPWPRCGSLAAPGLATRNTLEHLDLGRGVDEIDTAGLQLVLLAKRSAAQQTLRQTPPGLACSASPTVMEALQRPAAGTPDRARRAKAPDEPGPGPGHLHRRKAASCSRHGSQSCCTRAGGCLPRRLHACSAAAHTIKGSAGPVRAGHGGGTSPTRSKRCWTRSVTAELELCDAGLIELLLESLRPHRKPSSTPVERASPAIQGPQLQARRDTFCSASRRHAAGDQESGPPPPEVTPARRRRRD